MVGGPDFSSKMGGRGVAVVIVIVVVDQDYCILCPRRCRRRRQRRRRRRRRRDRMDVDETDDTENRRRRFRCRNFHCGPVLLSRRGGSLCRRGGRRAQIPTEVLGYYYVLSLHSRRVVRVRLRRRRRRSRYGPRRKRRISCNFRVVVVAETDMPCRSKTTAMMMMSRVACWSKLVFEDWLSSLCQNLSFSCWWHLFQKLLYHEDVLCCFECEELLSPYFGNRGVLAHVALRICGEGVSLFSQRTLWKLDLSKFRDVDECAPAYAELMLSHVAAGESARANRLNGEIIRPKKLRQMCFIQMAQRQSYIAFSRTGNWFRSKMVVLFLRELGRPCRPRFVPPEVPKNSAFILIGLLVLTSPLSQHSMSECLERGWSLETNVGTSCSRFIYGNNSSYVVPMPKAASSLSTQGPFTTSAMLSWLRLKWIFCDVVDEVEMDLLQ